MPIQAVDRRAEQTPVRSQADRPTCVAFAVTAAHEWMAGDAPSLSEEFAHWSAKSRDGIAGEATTVQWTLTGIAAEGQAPEIAWPYGQPPWPAGPPPAALDVGVRRSPGPWRRLASPDVGNIADEVGDGRAVVLTLGFVPAAWFAPAAGPLVDAPGGRKRAGGHAVLVVGARPAESALPDSLLIKNSWGERWGDGGYSYLSERYVVEYGVAAHVLEGS